MSFLHCDVTSSCLLWLATFMKTGYIHVGAVDSSLTVCSREKQQSKSSCLSPGSHGKRDPDAVSPSILPLSAASWRGVPITQASGSLLIFETLFKALHRNSCTSQPLGWSCLVFVLQIQPELWMHMWYRGTAKNFCLQSSPEDRAADLAVASRRCMANLWEQFLTCLYESAQKLIETRKEAPTI